ncbi:dehydratase [Rhodococcus sp. D2-41]|uniref:MaoC/PaaZ C-terminal domain-containing protein n=1 Tax=Speluncibacter jeojiensis TaxID=2710754 RepID=A0A9X4M5R1_9ACTN|nr:MaoC/PaaZ C-terminal domain-containing protein [Rhodococcus sp. D2-41]MDG3010255.1 dehydratase [Rhodococcus sp. D2-41]MDG3015768.1 MaoC/PaaZ C-terminal domain-containing protein [Corynebacteriales bacterium D3-21]
MTSDVVRQHDQPGMLGNYARAAVGMLPLGGGATAVPDRTLTLEGLRVDVANLAAYNQVCGLRLGDTLPLTYGFVLAFPSVMKLLVARDFPLPAMGMVHVQNRIESLRPVSVIEPLDLRVHAENLREHRKGTQVDLVSELNVGRELVWRQTSTFLKLGGGPSEAKEKAPVEEPVLPAPVTTLSVDANRIHRYAAVSGDRNPIHMSNLGAKAFGFPRTIAHGMWSAAAALGALEGRLPDAVDYDVRFGKPVLLPAKVNEYVTGDGDGNWEVSLRHPKKLYPHLTATIAAR